MYMLLWWQESPILCVYILTMLICFLMHKHVPVSELHYRYIYIYISVITYHLHFWTYYLPSLWSSHFPSCIYNFYFVPIYNNNSVLLLKGSQSHGWKSLNGATYESSNSVSVSVLSVWQSHGRKSLNSPMYMLLWWQDSPIMCVYILTMLVCFPMHKHVPVSELYILFIYIYISVIAYRLHFLTYYLPSLWSSHFPSPAGLPYE